MPPRARGSKGASVTAATTSGSLSQAEDTVHVAPWSNKLKKPIISAEKLKAVQLMDNQPQATSDSGSSNLAKTTRVRTVGKLIHLMEMPLESFFEVASALHPRDLLRLSRVSKQFRVTFMSRKSIGIWKQAQNTVPGLPECPPILSEPQYAALLFESNCFACGKTRALKLSYTLSIRLCSGCNDVNVIQGKSLLKKYCKEHGFRMHDTTIWTMGPLALTLLPRNEDTGSVDVDVDPKSNHANCYFYKPEFDLVLDRLRQLVNNTAEHDKFVNERRAVVVTMHNHGNVLATWQQESKLSEKERLDRIRERRRSSIIVKLSEVGYEQKDYPKDNSEWNRLIDKPARELTASNWTQLKPKLEKIISETNFDERAKTRIGEFLTLYPQYVLDLLNLKAEQLLMLPLPTYTHLEPYTEFIADGEGHIKCEGEKFEKAMVILLSDVVEKKTDEMKRTLTDQLLPLYRSPGSQDNAVDEEQILLYAASMFQCNISGQCTPGVFGYLEYVDHLWAYYKAKYWDNTTHRDVYRKPKLTINLYASEIAIAILKFVGLPLDTPYTEISGNIVCMCQNSAFKQPATFAQLIKHVQNENMWYENHYRFGCHEPGQGPVLRNDHDYYSQSPTLRLAQASELQPSVTFPAWPWAVKKDPPSSKMACCRICSESTLNSLFWFRVNLDDPSDFIHHLKASQISRRG